MTRGRVKLFPDKVSVKDNPNFKRLEGTTYYFSKMGDVVRIDDKGEEHTVIPSKMKNVLCVHASHKVVGVARTIYDLFIGIKNKNNVIIHINGIVTDNSLNNLKEVPRSYCSRHKAGRKPRLVYDLNTKKIYRSARQYAEQNYYSFKTVNARLNGRFKERNLIYITEEEAMEL